MQNGDRRMVLRGRACTVMRVLCLPVVLFRRIRRVLLRRKFRLHRPQVVDGDRVRYVRTPTNSTRLQGLGWVRLRGMHSTYGRLE